MNAELEPVRQSFIAWMLAALGAKYAILLPVVALVSLVLVLVVVTRGRGPMAAAALVLLCPLPLLIGLLGALEGVIGSYHVIAISQSAPKPSELADGISMSLVAPLVGLLLMTPTLLVAVLGSVMRSLTDAPTSD